MLRFGLALIMRHRRRHIPTIALGIELLGRLGDGLAGKGLLLPEIFHSLAFELRFGSYLYEFLVPLLEQREIEAEGFDDAAGFGIAIAIAPALGIVAHDKDTGFLERAIEGLGAALGEPEKLRLVAQLGPCNGPAAFLPILRLFAVFRHEPIDEFVCVSW
jgi:hypothetical protein